MITKNWVPGPTIISMFLNNIDEVKLEKLGKRDMKFLQIVGNGNLENMVFILSRMHSNFYQESNSRKSDSGHPTGNMESYLVKLASKKMRGDSMACHLELFADQVNLHKRITLPADEQVCALCGGANEDINHLFMHCPKIQRIWNLIMLNLGCHWGARPKSSLHLLFSSLLLGKLKKKLLLTFWTGTIWIVWKWHNEIIFNQGTWDEDIF